MTQNSYTLILIVDDEAKNINLMSELLSQAGYSVMSAQDGFKAVAACRVRLPDLIILDIQMPLINGLEVRKMLKSDDRTAKIPIIFLDQKTNVMSLTNKNQLNHQEILYKPFDPADLLARIQFVIENKQLKDELSKQANKAKVVNEFDENSPIKSERYLKEFLLMSLKQSKRYKVDLSILIIGLDNAQLISDNLNSSQYQELINAVGQKISLGLRDSDVISLTGASEYTIVLTHTNKNGAIEVAERIRNSIMNTTFLLSTEQLKVTVSIGLCQYIKEMNDNVELLISHAKMALTQGLKANGNITLMAE